MIPQHVAIIPDGNRRWAKQRNLPSLEGHRQVVDTTLPALIEKAAQLGIPYFTFWVMSTENFTRRAEDEVSGLFNLGRIFIKKKLQQLKEKGVRIQAIGNLATLPPDIQELLHKSIVETAQNTKITLTFAVNYGGRDEIIRAIHKLRPDEFQTITSEQFSKVVDTAYMPDPDFIIRTGGEKRLSGFMLWQSEYSEYYFTDLLLPDFTPAEFENAINDYEHRQRRFGK